jgi:hypothetical protein
LHAGPGGVAARRGAATLFSAAFSKDGSWESSTQSRRIRSAGVE